MDFGSILEVGIVSFLLSSLVLSITLLMARNRVKAFLFASITEYLSAFMLKTKENPQFVVETLKPALLEIMKSFSSPDNQMGAEQGGIGGIAMNFLPKKYRAFAPLIQAFMGGQNNPTTPNKALNKSPFE
ncbi:MAG: hypothetical protein ACYCO0_05300 [Candidatus Micrarchaeaceae archaeon]